MRKLEIYVCTGEEKYDYRLIAELGKKKYGKPIDGEISKISSDFLNRWSIPDC